MKRCSWVENKDELYQNYHDNEWGVPKFDDKELFELLILEGFQAGLSWYTILRKRENFRKAFDNFDYIKISKYNDTKINELLKNEGIVRSKLKIQSAISNAKIFIKIQQEFGSFSKYIWHFTNNTIVKNINDTIPVKSELSDIVSKDLKKRGMKYVGSVIIYAYLQAIGVINDHETDCFKYKI